MPEDAAAVTAMSSCPSCGSGVYPGTRFCGDCGTDISAEQAMVTTESVDRPSITQMVETEMLGALREATLGKYDIKGELGRGGMAIVYLAHDIALERKVAIKVISPTVLSGAGVEARFRREAKTAASLSHPNIIPIHVVDETDRIMYFVMKYVSGRPLDSVIGKLGPMPVPMVATVLSQVASALDYAHRRGVIHRDIKPANVIIDEEGWVIVTDFGIAKIADAENITASDAAVGTPSYMSPEQCSGKELTGSADQYSLGIMAYEMLSGRVPFRGSSIMEIMKQHFFDPPPPLLEVRPECPPNLAEIVDRMLAKDPADRYGTLEEVVFALDARPLSRDDPIRTQMIDLAISGEKEKVVTQLKTPRSPVPASREMKKSDPAQRPSQAPTEVAPAANAFGSGRWTWHWRGPALGSAATIAVLVLGWVGYTRMTGVSPGVIGDPIDGPAPSGMDSSAAMVAAGSETSPEDRPGPDSGASVSPPDPGPGVVMVQDAPPGARFLADGRPQSGPTFALDRGDHRVEVRADGFEPYRETVRVAGDDTVLVAWAGVAVADPEPDVARALPEDESPPPLDPIFLFLRTSVAAEISVDGRLVGNSVRYADTLETGVAHRIEVRRAGYVPWDTVLPPSTTGRTQVQVTLRPQNEDSR